MSNGVSNGWAEYQRLVLAELERHNNKLVSIDTSLQEIKIELALQKKETGRILNVETRVDKLEDQYDVIHQGDIIDRAIRKYRKYIFGIILAILTAIIAPLIKLITG